MLGRVAVLGCDDSIRPIASLEVVRARQIEARDISRILLLRTLHVTYSVCM
jgi:hypothetical protein